MIRLRRLRGSEAIRNMVRENRVNKEDLVYPMFVAEGTGIKNPVDSMPGIYQYSLDTFEEELRRVAESARFSCSAYRLTRMRWVAARTTIRESCRKQSGG